MAAVTAVSAGPPSGGLYLIPPSSGGLCEGVTTIPSASPVERPRFQPRMAWEITGVGTGASPSEITTATPFAASTSSAVRSAGADSPCVSRPRKSGPVIPAAARCSATACATARMCASLKLRRSEEPRWPEVPKATRWAGSRGSGASSW